MDLKQLTLAACDVLVHYYETQGDMVRDAEPMIAAKPSEVNKSDFWKHWIVDVVDPDGIKGYADHWAEIFIRIQQIL